MTAAARVQRHRERQRDGKAVLAVTVDLGRLVDILVDAKLLAQWDEQDKRAIAAALEQAIGLWMAAEEQRRQA